MLEMKIKRFARLGNALHGHLTIDGMWVCDTLENADTCLAGGKYQLAIKRVESEGCRMMVIDAKGRFAADRLKDGRLPMVKSSNGAWGLSGGNISVGCCEHLGYIVRCEMHHALLFDRLRKCLGRKGRAQLWIEG